MNYIETIEAIDLAAIAILRVQEDLGKEILAAPEGSSEQRGLQNARYTYDVVLVRLRGLRELLAAEQL